MPRKSLPTDNKTNSNSSVQQPGDLQQPSTSTSSIKVVAVESVNTEELDDSNEIFTPMEFEFVDQNVASDRYDEEFDEHYLSRLNNREG